MTETLTAPLPEENAGNGQQLDLTHEQGWSGNQLDLTNEKGWSESQPVGQDSAEYHQMEFDVKPISDAEVNTSELVTVKRTSGDIENDWSVEGILDGKVRVFRPREDGNRLEKDIPLEDFRSLNPDFNLQPFDSSSTPEGETAPNLQAETGDRMKQAAKEYFDSLDKYFNGTELGRDHNALETIKEMRKQLAEAEGAVGEATLKQLQELGIDEESMARLAPGKIDEALTKFRNAKITELSNLIKYEPDKKVKEVDRVRESLTKILTLPEDQFVQLEKDWEENRKNQAHEQAIKEDKSYKVGEQRRQAKDEIASLQEKYGGVLNEVARLPLDRDPAGNIQVALKSYGERKAAIDHANSEVDPDLLRDVSRAKALEDINKELTEKYRSEGLNDEQIKARLDESQGSLDTWLARMGDSTKALEDLKTFELQLNKERLWNAKRQKTREYLSSTLLPRSIRGLFNKAETKTQAPTKLDIKEILSKGVDHNGSHTKAGGEALLGGGGRGLWEQTVSNLELARNLARNESGLMRGLIYLTFAQKGIESGADAVWNAIPDQTKKEARKKFMLGMTVAGRAILRASVKAAEKSRKAGATGASAAAIRMGTLKG